ncbi:MAG: hypothetical protein IKE05_01235 [Clostridia bacterium]|nr:hypothetical protein [Clostridia bacterium]
MNYLKEILTFENWLDYNSNVNKSDIRLWYTLMYTANRFNWKEFSISISSLIFKSKLSKSDIYRSRNKLKQFGLIDFKEKKGNQCTVYKINSCVSLFGTHFGTQFETESGTTFDTPFNTVSETPIDTNVGNINKTKNINKNINKNKKEIIKEKFGEFENVLLSVDELQKLKSKLGAETESYIERLSSYIASSGKRYKSHYATILSWTQKDAKNSGGVSYGISPKKLCTEYPE